MVCRERWWPETVIRPREEEIDVSSVGSNFFIDIGGR